MGKYQHKYENLVGKQYGRWTVLEEAEPKYDTKNHLRRFWLCECSCENHTRKIISGTSLKSGHSSSCGCKRIENAIPAMKEVRKGHNTFIIKNDYCEVYDTSGNKFLIDTDDIEMVKKHYWYVCVVNKNSTEKAPTSYVFTHIRDQNSKKDNKVSLHFYLTNQKYTDHINHDGLDNRRCNLRFSNNPNISNQSMNNYNQKLSKNNIHGYKGIVYHKDIKRWGAYIGINSKQINLGYFATKEEAIEARKEGEKKYIKEWTYEQSEKIAKNNQIIS